MSVKRYDRQEIYDVTYRAAGDECLPEPSENGEFVLHSDYARLKAEVERLRKAGDVLAKRCDVQAFYPSDRDIVKAWNAAKEGKQS